MHKFEKKKIELAKTLRFKNNLKFLLDSSKWKKSDIEKYQNKNFLDIIKHAYNNTVFYNKLLKKNGFCLSDFQSIKDLQKLPFLGKNEVRKSNNQIKSNKIISGQKIYYMTTGGTTGNPLKVWMDDNYKSFSLACTYFYMSSLNFDITNSRSVRIHGNTINQKKISKKVYWEYDKKNKSKLVMSSYHINSKTINKYVDEIHKHNPIYLHCYPSVIFLMANLIKSLNIKIKLKIKAIFIDSEKLYDYQKNVLVKIFKCPVYSIYGHTEGAVFGYPKKNSSNFFIHPAVGYLELIDDNNKSIKKPGIKGEIVVTGFLNKIFPLIRYKTEDYGILAKTNSDQVVLKKIFGRKQDFILNKNKDKVPIGPALFDYNFDWSGVEKFQIHQKKLGEIVFYIVYSVNKNEENIIKKKIIDQFTKLLNFQFLIKVKKTKDIKFTKRGKFKYLAQHMKAI